MNLKKLSIQCLSVVIGMTTLKANATCAPLLDHSVRQLAGEQVDRLCEVYQGQVVLIVNTASKCGFTPQFDGLEALYRKYQDQGFTVLGFPSKDFGNQEYGSEEEAADFCRLTYGVQFPMYATTHDLYPRVYPGSKVFVPKKEDDVQKTSVAEIVGYTTSLVSIIALIKSL